MLRKNVAKMAPTKFRVRVAPTKLLVKTAPTFGLSITMVQQVFVKICFLCVFNMYYIFISTKCVCVLFCVCTSACHSKSLFEFRTFSFFLLEFLSLHLFFLNSQCTVTPKNMTSFGLVCLKLIGIAPKHIPYS